MKNKHKKVLNFIFSNPINWNIEWRKIEALFLALGATELKEQVQPLASN